MNRLLWKDAQDTLPPHHDMPGTISPGVGAPRAFSGLDCAGPGLGSANFGRESDDPS